MEKPAASGTTVGRAETHWDRDRGAAAWWFDVPAATSSHCRTTASRGRPTDFEKEPRAAKPKRQAALSPRPAAVSPEGQDLVNRDLRLAHDAVVAGRVDGAPARRATPDPIALASAAGTHDEYQGVGRGKGDAGIGDQVTGRVALHRLEEDAAVSDHHGCAIGYDSHRRDWSQRHDLNCVRVGQAAARSGDRRDAGLPSL